MKPKHAFVISSLRKLVFFAIVSALSLAFLASCRKNSAPAQDRYVVLSPEVGEILAGLGLSSSIVGASEECDYPAELANVQKVGNFGMVNREAVIKLDPTIVFTSALEQDAISAELKKLGYRVETYYPKSIQEMQNQILLMGRMLGKEEAATGMVADIRATLDSIAAHSVNKPKPKVYIEINRDPLMSVSDQSFVGQLIEAAGADNVFGTLARDYCRISPEDVVRAAPDIIICYSQDSLSGIKTRKGWQDIPAIRNNMILFEKDINPDLIQRAGPRIKDGLHRLSELYDTWEKAY